MPKAKDGRAIQLMKAISMFDIEDDYNDSEARDKLAIMFRELIMSDESQAKEFLERFLGEADKVIADMGVIDKPAEVEPDDEVDLPTGDDASVEEEPMDDEPVEPDADVEPEAEVGGDEEVEEEIPDDLLGDSVDPLITRANRFIYI